MLRTELAASLAIRKNGQEQNPFTQWPRQTERTAMKTERIPELPAVAVWHDVLRFNDSITSNAARALLKFEFTPAEVEDMQNLTAQARCGKLSASQAIEIDTFELLGCLLDILHSNARRVLKRRKVTA